MTFINRLFRFTPETSVFKKIATLSIALLLLIIGLMFSAVLLVALVVVGSLGGAWLWWKTRHLRRQMREQRQTSADDTPQGRIIDGEIIASDSPSPSHTTGGKTYQDETIRAIEYKNPQN